MDYNKIWENVLNRIENYSKLLYNPIIIYGSEDNIKEYMNSFKVYISLKANESLSLLHITTEKFIADIDKINVDDIDMFVLESIEKMENNKKAQYKLFDIFNVLYDKGKPIIISTTKIPDDLQTFEERLITRLNWGVVIKLPNKIKRNKMDYNKIWRNVLNRIKNDVNTLVYATWFENTKLYIIKRNKATVIVQTKVHKEHLDNEYKDLIVKYLFNEIEKKLDVEFVLQRDLETKKI